MGVQSRDDDENRLDCDDVPGVKGSGVQGLQGLVRRVEQALLLSCIFHGCIRKPESRKRCQAARSAICITRFVIYFRFYHIFPRPRDVGSSMNDKPLAEDGDAQM